MELWIRSQDGENLIETTGLRVIENRIQMRSYGEGILTIGTYKTKERALEVLDEIQKLLMPISEYKQEVDTLVINYKNIDTTVYEMPKE